MIVGVMLVTDVAVARPNGRLNMPARWTWPPSAAMKRSGRRCLKQLRKLGVHFRRAPRLRKVATPVRVPSMNFRGLKLVPIWRKPPFTMDCRLALAFACARPRH